MACHEIPCTTSLNKVIHITTFQVRYYGGSGQKRGPIRTIFNNIRPLAKTCRYKKFHQYACGLNRRQQHGQANRQPPSIKR